MQEQLEFTLLDKEQVKEELFFSKVTDFSILLGVKFDKITKNGYWWTKNPVNKKSSIRRELPELSISVYIANPYEKMSFCGEFAAYRSTGVRPVFKYSELEKNIITDISKDKEFIEIECGEYPQTIAPKKIARQLEREYKKFKLKTTGKTYSVDTTINNYVFNSIERRIYEEIEYKGKKYVRCTCNKNYYGMYEKYLKFRFSNDEKIEKDKAYWIEVEPVKWIVDLKQDIAISKDILFSGVQFHDPNTVKLENSFENSYMKVFLNEIFAKEIKLKGNDIKYENNVNIKEYNDVELLVLKIDELLENITNKDKIALYVNSLLLKYNEELQKLKINKNDSILELNIITEKDLKKEITDKLNNIILKIEIITKNNKIYCDLLKKINSYIELFDNLKVENTDDELLNDLKNINNTCLPFLNEKDSKNIKNDIISVLNNEKEIITNYIKIIENIDNDIKVNDKINYDSLDSFELYLRNQLQPILENLNDKVNKRDIELEVKESINKITNNLYENSKDKFINVYLNEINKVNSNIQNLLITFNPEEQKYYSKELLSILNNKIDFDKSELEILTEVRNKYTLVYKLFLEVEELSNKYNNINKQHVRIMVNHNR